MLTTGRNALSWSVALLSIGLLTACADLSDAVDGESQRGGLPAHVAMSIETPEGGSLDLPFSISGWAFDETALQGTGVQRVQVLDGGCEGAVLGAAEYGLSRPDISETYGNRFHYSGWVFEATRLHAGERILAVRVFAQGTDTYDACEVLPVTIEE